MRIADRRRLVVLNLAEVWRRGLLALSYLRPTTVRGFGVNIQRLVVAPTDLRAVDPFIAEEICAGRFPLAGQVVEAGESSPFVLELPSRRYALRLHGFSWLRHIRADKSPLACARARRIVDDWIALHGSRINGVAWEPEVMAQRIVAWLSHSPIVLQDADAGFYRRFLASLSHQAGHLMRIAPYVADGLPKLQVRIALAMMAISTDAPKAVRRRADRQLNKEIERQILADGTHVSRNPQIMLELLFDLLPLRQTYINLGHEVPSKLIPAIDRIYPAVRFFRHSSGDMALFNGATSALATDLMSVLRYDETAGQPFKALPHGEYQRMSAGGTVLLVDTGCPAPGFLSRSVHAGCLSFELSSGRNRFIINCGSPRYAGEKYQQMARVTAAHSTVCVGDVSSCRFSKSAFLGPIVAEGVSRVTLDRQTGPDGSDRLIASHNGYLHRFGLIHEREIRLNEVGNKLAGRDRLLSADCIPVETFTFSDVIARFHVHPAIALQRIDERSVRLLASDGESWTFSTPAGGLSIREDVFFADVSGIRQSQQIEMVFGGPEIRWFLTRHA
ncbi:heparinase II/III family protein [Peteryoungia desertarenae]|uniref:Heparinase II/III family protein n=1 Tax=Peteryoungia desertarenae TaxID=1813451 RepID=A0ABX6QJV3_9HYPH|nr:heparinase II/III family protein [Peteryoungia desertarenae]QLF68841.1 heparinase II/III family protein [Peteryoungia desertarenae]